jgi:hypothetical protein
MFSGTGRPRPVSATASTRARWPSSPGRQALDQPETTAGQKTGGSDINYLLIMKNAQSELVAIGPVSIEYQAAMLRDEIEESSDWTSVGIARVLTEAQARAVMNPQTS